jgi:radical SAM superfamily enzyme YgiQ (UPF0313 family)
VKVLDLNLHGTDPQYELLSDVLHTFQPDIVGISMMFDSSYKHLGPISRLVKSAAPGALVLAGGASVSTWWDEIISEQHSVDALCYSEGELAMTNLVNAQDPWEELNKDPWITRESQAAGRAPKAMLLAGIDDAVQIDYSLVDVSHYKMEETYSPFQYSRKKEARQFFIGTSRGCPFKCVFCALPTLNGRSMRYASLDVIERHIRQLIDNFGLNVLTIYDDQLLVNRSRAKQLFRMLAKYNLRIEAPSGFTAAYIDDEMAQLMKTAGLDTATLAIESGSDYVLQHVIHKPLRVHQIAPAVQALHKCGIFVKGFFVIGIPGERDEDRHTTVQFIKDIGLDWSSINLAYPFRGTEMYDDCLKRGYISKAVLGNSSFGEYTIQVPGTDPASIARFAYTMNLDVNFVNNHRMRLGDFATAASCFEQIVARFDRHAFAHYFLARAYRNLPGKETSADLEMTKYKEIVAEDETWSTYATHFGLSSC